MRPRRDSTGLFAKGSGRPGTPRAGCSHDGTRRDFLYGIRPPRDSPGGMQPRRDSTGLAVRDLATAGLPGRDAATAGLNGISFGSTRSIIRVGLYSVRAPRAPRLLSLGGWFRYAHQTSNIYSVFSTRQSFFITTCIPVLN